MLVVLAVAAGWPLARTIFFAFTDARLAGMADASFVGLENFWNSAWGGLLSDPGWWRAVRNTLVFTAVSVGIETVLGIVIALVLDSAFRGRGLVRAIVLIPWAIPTIVSAKIWGWMLHDQFGVVNDLLLRAGLIAAPVAWLAGAETSLAAVILVDVWKTTPFMALLLLAALQVLPRDIYEAARLDGVGPAQGLLPHHAAADLAGADGGGDLSQPGRAAHLRRRLCPDRQLGGYDDHVDLRQAAAGRFPGRRLRLGGLDAPFPDDRADRRLRAHPRPRPADRHGPMSMRSTAFRAVVALIVLWSVFPFYYAVMSSFQSGSALFEPSYLPAPDLGNYAAVFAAQPFARNIGNSVAVAAAVVALSLALGVTAAYALGRLRFRGRGLLLVTILSVSMFPQVAVLSGMFELIRVLGLYNTLPALVFANMMLTLPFTVWVLTTFMRDLPKELEEAALVDGATHLQVVWHVFLPLLRPAMAATGLLAFIVAWNEFLFALTFTISNEMRTVPVAIALMSGASEHELPWGRIMAASVIVTVPLILLVLVFQRRIVSGLTAGAVKG